MNVATMVGRLTRDPETRQSATGTTITNFRIAVDRRFKRDGQPDADFFAVVCFGKTAEFVAKYFKKGMRIGLSGSLQNDTYEDKDGVRRTNTQIVADAVEFVESKKETADNAPAPVKELPQAEDFVEIPDDFPEELPFN